MSNFVIDATHPWLFMLLIPALFLTLFPYFRMQKKYRRTRNRIVSMVLHMSIMLLCISVLAGMTFKYDVPNKENEILLLVDMSDSGGDADVAEQRDEFVQSVIENSDPRFRLGVVTFGYDQVYAAPLTDDPSGVYQAYKNAQMPNTSATDLSAALTYASGLFEHPQTAKIVLISDGVQTDGNASAVIRSVASKGPRVDTVCFPGKTADKESEIIDVVLPEQSVAIGAPFTVGVTIKSVFSEAAPRAVLSLYDNGVRSVSADFDVTSGVQTVNMTHTFTEGAYHELRFVLHGSSVTSPVSDGDMTENNTYYTYMYVNEFNNILLIERKDGASNEFIKSLDGQYTPTVVRVDDTEKMPTTVDELRKYDQVILFNISNAEMSFDFVSILEQYVHEIGGGLFTVGGDKDATSDGKTESNAYNRTDMLNGSPLYQQMLPIQAIKYTPPLAVMIVIDRSGSMMTQSTGGKTRLDYAKEGALSCLNALSERDYCGVMTLEDEYKEEIQISRATQKAKITAAINNIGSEGTGGTIYTGALVRAGTALNTVDVEYKHIILVTDGEPGDQYEEYSKAIQDNAKNGISLSIVSIAGSNEGEMQNAVAESFNVTGRGRYHNVTADRIDDLPFEMREDLRVPEITEISPDPFTPTVNPASPIANGIDVATMPQLSGYYGTKLKDGAEQPIKGAYVPIYAQWKYGAGTVGSFMSDLEGKWSREFLDSETGRQLLLNILSGLFPTSDIRAKDIDLELAADNYKTRVSIYTEQLKTDERLEVTVTYPPENGADARTATYSFGASDNYSRITLETLVPGIYTIDVKRYGTSGEEPIAQTVAYKAFSYSKEYDAFADADAGRQLLADLAKDGGGKVVEAAEDVFGEVVRTNSRVVDPKIAFIIIAVILFLLDIAVRKFKFKWIHELIREHKAKKQAQTGGGK